MSHAGERHHWQARQEEHRRGAMEDELERVRSRVGSERKVLSESRKGNKGALQSTIVDDRITPMICNRLGGE